MREITFETLNKPTSETEIQAFESKMGVSLPEVYKIFLLTYNGGNGPTPGCFDYNRNDNQLVESDILGFAGLGLEGYTSLYSIQNLESKPDDMFVIAWTSRSEPICINMESDKLGTIYVWEKNSSGNLAYVAEEFDHFLDMLYEEM